MSARGRQASGAARSLVQRVVNSGKVKGVRVRIDALNAYAMDRLLCRLGRSPHAQDFYLKGGVLVANLLNEPHRFTRDIDLLRRYGAPSPDELREVFRQVARVDIPDLVCFDPDDVRASQAVRERDGYDGVTVHVAAVVGDNTVDVKIDVGFGDAVVPSAERIELEPFLEGDPPARVYAYQAESVLAEKIETVIDKFPDIKHRLKDILDVSVLALREGFSGEVLVDSLRATFQRRAGSPDEKVIDDMYLEFRGKQKKKWDTDWSMMLKDKRALQQMTLLEAVAVFDQFVRPLLRAMDGGDASRCGTWRPRGPWIRADCPG